jgi:very-short-patch-repair endonuclease
MSRDVAEKRRIGTFRRTRDGELVRLAARQHGVVALGQLLALGFTRSMIRRRMEAERLLWVQPKVYSVLPSLRTPGRMMAAVLSCGPRAALSHRAAAAVWDLCPWPAGAVDVSVVGSRKPREGVRIHRLHRIDIVTHDGFPVTSPTRTLVDLAAKEPAPRVERAYEQADRLGLLDADALLAECDRRRGSRLLRALVDDGREAPPTRSELERALLHLCRDRGLPPPSQNVSLHGVEVDAYWPQYRLVVELDGYEWHRTRRAFEEDRRRDALLATHGIRVLRFTWRQVQRRPREVAEALAASAGR